MPPSSRLSSGNLTWVLQSSVFKLSSFVGIRTCGCHCDQEPASMAKCWQP
eukprot:00848.XXX_3107_3256_1 [CDS] Oithona nana genome sequencing.